MATDSSILAWRIPWTEEPGGLQSSGSQRVGPDWALTLSFWGVLNFLMQTLNRWQDNTPQVPKLFDHESLSMGHDMGLEFIQEFWRCTEMNWRPHPILARRLGQAPFICKKWGKQEFSVAWSRLHEITPDAFFVFPFLLSLITFSFLPSFPPTLPSSPLLQPASKWAPLGLCGENKWAGQPTLKAISFAELYGLFFPPEAGSVWTQHLGDKLCLILSSQKKRERKKKEVESN